jgi:hypothetical protein
MALVLGGGFTGEGGVPPGTVESILTRNTWAVLALEVSPGLIAEAEPNAYQFLCHSLIGG